MTLPDIETSVSPAEAAALVEHATGKVVLEVGSWRGFSTVAMGLVATRVHAVDHHLGDEHAGHDESLSMLIANIDRYGVRSRVIVHVGDAVDVLPMLRHSQFDFAFIDAFHETEAVLRDADLVLPLVVPGGLIAFHDYGRFGVADAVDLLCSEQRVYWVEMIETLAIVEKV